MVEGSKSSLMACHFMVVPNLLLTPHWYVLSTGMAPQLGEQLSKMVWC